MATTINTKGATIKINLDGTIRVIKNLDKIDLPMDQGAQGIVRTDILDNWSKRQGGDGASMPRLSGAYARRKAAGKVRVGNDNRGGDPIRNLLLTGDMQRAFHVFKIKRNSYKLAFDTDKENTKATNNHKLSNDHMMKVSKKIRKKYVRFINKALFKGAR